MKSRVEKLVEDYPEMEFLVMDGLDDAIIGVVNDDKVVYSTSKVIEVLMKEMDEEEAWEHFYFNISGCYVGEKTPMFVDDTSFT
jgi:hypothetical protein